MDPKLRRFAPLGLYLALLAVLVSISLYIIQREWNIYLQISLGAIVVGLALYAIFDPENVRTLFTRRQARYGSNSLVMAVAFIGIVVVINYVVFKNPKRWDLTEDQTNTLAAETIDTLKALPQPVEALAFFTTRVSSESAKNVLEQYEFESNGNFTYRFIDPDADPLAAQDAKITRDGMVVIKMGDRQEPVEFVSEKEMTSALVRLISNETRAVYFLTGHGEFDPDGTGDQAYSSVKLVLESKNYIVAKLNLLSSSSVPADARVIVVAGPKQPLTTDEVARLQAFVEQGGALIVMEEPLPLTDFGDAADPLADYLDQSWGVLLGNNMVVDPTLQQPLVAVGAAYANHPITSQMQGLAALFPSSRSVTLSGDHPELNLVELVLTSEQAWGEIDLTLPEGGETLQLTPDADRDLMGPVSLVVVGESQLTPGRVAVFGDADFAGDANFSQYGNGDLIINTIDWAAGQEELINLTPKDTVQRVLVPPARYTTGLILFAFVFLIPGAVLVSGIVVWVQRRKRG